MQPSDLYIYGSGIPPYLKVYLIQSYPDLLSWAIKMSSLFLSALQQLQVYEQHTLFIVAREAT